MSEDTKDQDDGIGLIDLFAIIWRWKWMIIVITLVAAIGAVMYCEISRRMPPEESFFPDEYTASAYMLIDSGSSGGVSSMLSSMGGLASLVGISLPGGSSSSGLAIYMVTTNSMLDSVVDGLDLVNRFNLAGYSSPRTAGRNIIRKTLTAEYDGSSGVFTISFTHIDPAFAMEVVNFSTDCLAKRFDELGLDKNKITKENLELNIANTFQEILEFEEESRRLERSIAFGSSLIGVPTITTEINRIALELRTRQEIYTQLKVQLELLKVSIASEKPVFQILEMAEVPESKSGPNRNMVIIIVTLVAGVFALFLAFALNAVLLIKNDPQAMAKLRGKSEK